MSLYKRNYWVTLKDGTRERRTAKTWTIEFTRPDGRPFKQNSRLRDKKAAQIMENDLRRRFEMGQVGAIDPYRQHKAAPLADHLEKFADELRSQKRDDMYVYTARKRLDKVAAAAGWRTLADVTLNGFTEWRRAESKRKNRFGRLPNPKTLNQYLDTWRQFLEWCVETDRVGANPLAKVRKIAATDNPDYRRAATREELTKFLNACGPAERDYYRFALLTGLRRGTLDDLLVGDARDVESDAPWLQIRAETFKGRRPLRHPLHPDLVPLLRSLVAGRTPTERLFADPPDIYDMHETLARAGVKQKDSAGNQRLDLHAFRKTLTAWMEEAGVSIRDAQQVLGHRHVSTTERHYRAAAAVKDHGLGKVPGLKLDGGAA